MSIIASDFIDLEGVDPTQAAIKKTDCHAHQGLICGGPISTFVPKILINTSAKFGACITK